MASLRSEDEKEPEMEIGFPTDVKHVAHIGGDGPTNSKPSWMTHEFNSTPELSSNQSQQTNDEVKYNVPPVKNEEAKQSSKGGRTNPNLLVLVEATSTEKPKHKSRRKSQSTGSDPGLVSPKGSDKAARHRRTCSSSSMESEGGSPTREPSNHRTRRHRHHSKVTDLPPTGQSQDQPPIPRKRKSKGTSKSKGQNSISDISDLET